MTNPNSYESVVNIPHTVLNHFGITTDKPAISTLLEQLKGSKKVFTFVVDGLGYNFLIKNTTEDPRLNKLKEKNRIQKIPTTFPASTAPALLALNSGEYPIEHGLLEWNLYVPELDDVIKPLPYISATQEAALPELPQMIFSGTTIYQELNNIGIKSYFFAPEEYINSVFSSSISKGAEPVGYVDAIDLAKKLKEKVEYDQKPAYLYVYWPSVDTAEHSYGPSSEEARNALYAFLDLLYDKVINKISRGSLQDCFLILTADHGQIDVRKTFFLNDYPKICNYFQKSKRGKEILPSGNGRDVFLHINEAFIEEFFEQFNSELGNIGEAKLITHTTIKELFGESKPHRDFLSRLGNVIILPKDKYKIWYQYNPDERKELLGDHGGRSDDEVYVPLISARFEELASK